MTDANANEKTFLGGFYASRGGMLIRMGAGLGIISTGALTAMGGGHMSPLVGAVAMFVCVALCIAGMAFSLEDYPLQSVVALMFLPPALWVFYMGLPFVAKSDPTMGWIAAVLGVIPLLLRGKPDAAKA